MASFIQSVLRICRNIFFERAVIVSVLSFLIILTVDSVRTREAKGIYEGCFWLMKSDWKNRADIVVAGDSRTGSGVSPAKMSEHLPGRIILNYAFDGVQFHEEYLRSIPKVLNSHTSEKVVILGITPRTLIDSGITNDQFKDSKRLSKYHSEILLAIVDRPLRLLYPMRIRDFLYMFFPGEDKRRFFRIYHADGWAERNAMQSDSEKMVNLYKETFFKHQVSPGIIAGLLRFVQEWTKVGIKVYGFRPPTSPQMFEAEIALSGFDEKSFVLSFEQAGGTWIAVKQTGYPTYDGSHLRPDAAEAFSFNLGAMISERLNDRFNVQRKLLGYAVPAAVR